MSAEPRTPGPRRGLVLAALLAGVAGPCAAQLLTPNTTLVVPPERHARLEVDLSWYRPEAFVDAYGNSQRFPGALDFGLAVASASYSPVAHFALGLVVPYRATRLDLGVDGAAASSSGNPGVGVFVDWTSGPCRGRALCPTIRLGYYHARTDSSRTITTSDGIDRVSLLARLAPSATREAGPWQGAGTLYVSIGQPVGTASPLVESRLQLELGRALGAGETPAVRCFALAGLRAATSATEEGVYFHGETSSSWFAGARLDWQLDPPNPERRTVRVSVTRDLRPENALEGWRVAIAFAATL